MISPEGLRGDMIRFQKDDNPAPIVITRDEHIAETIKEIEEEPSDDKEMDEFQKADLEEEKGK